MFRLNNQEFANSGSQFVTSSWGGRRFAPNVFTEQGDLYLPQSKLCGTKCWWCVWLYVSMKES